MRIPKKNPENINDQYKGSSNPDQRRTVAFIKAESEGGPKPESNVFHKHSQ